MKQRKTAISAVSLFLAVVLLVACGAPETGIWQNATYGTDTTLGEGATAFKLEVTGEGKTVTFTVNTDETNLGAALLGLKLIDGEMGAYGLYVKVVDGMTADYDVDASYWAFYIDGEMAMTGVDGAEIVAGTTYRLAYTK